MCAKRKVYHLKAVLPIKSVSFGCAMVTLRSDTFVYKYIDWSVYPSAGRAFFRCDSASLKEVVSICWSVRPSVGTSVGPFIPNMAIIEGNESSNDITIIGTISEDEVVASHYPNTEPPGE